ncbi:ion channel [Algoriphagus limi]|uniref:Ion channel n=1 Tax=Algoriphagus limi TaxID=2975273 RepID=A0ABT2G3Q4_9BACT|nr:ion channel [Algoriphagus limi]MCS5489896.1 ion channel [Algoriphagus limi]
MSKKVGAKISKLEEERNRKDSGFGTATTSNRARLILPDGSFNVKRKGQSFSAWLNLYHRMITMPVFEFVLVIAFSYFIVNLVFAGIYYSIGIEHLSGIDEQTQFVSPFWGAFFFSSQTLTTVGYGHISPLGSLTNAVAAVEALVGLMMFALITGLVYGRFSTPSPKILFSRNILVSPYLDMNGLMFRMINERNSHLINVKVNVMMSRNEKDETGKLTRKYYNLALERDFIQFFSTSWTVVHPITPDSPFFKETPEKMAASDTEILIAVEGMNDAYSDSVHVRTSYLYNEFVWGRKFVPILSEKGTGYIIDLDKINDSMEASLNS